MAAVEKDTQSEEDGKTTAPRATTAQPNPQAEDEVEDVQPVKTAQATIPMKPVPSAQVIETDSPKDKAPDKVHWTQNDNRKGPSTLRENSALDMSSSAIPKPAMPNVKRPAAKAINAKPSAAQRLPNLPGKHGPGPTAKYRDAEHARSVAEFWRTREPRSDNPGLTALQIALLPQTARAANRPAPLASVPEAPRGGYVGQLQDDTDHTATTSEESESEVEIEDDGDEDDASEYEE